MTKSHRSRRQKGRSDQQSHIHQSGPYDLVFLELACQIYTREITSIGNLDTLLPSKTLYTFACKLLDIYRHGNYEPYFFWLMFNRHVWQFSGFEAYPHIIKQYAEEFTSSSPAATKLDADGLPRNYNPYNDFQPYMPPSLDPDFDPSEDEEEPDLPDFDPF